MKGNPLKRNFGLPTDNMASPMMKNKVTTKINPDGTITKSKDGKSSTYSVDPKNPKRYVNPKGGEFFVKKSPAKQEKKRMMTSEFRKKKKGNIPFPNLKNHGDGTYSITAPDGKINLTKSEYTRAKALNKEYGY